MGWFFGGGGSRRRSMRLLSAAVGDPDEWGQILLLPVYKALGEYSGAFEDLEEDDEPEPHDYLAALEASLEVSFDLKDDSDEHAPKVVEALVEDCTRMWVHLQEVLEDAGSDFSIPESSALVPRSIERALRRHLKPVLRVMRKIEPEREVLAEVYDDFYDIASENEWVSQGKLLVGQLTAGFTGSAPKDKRERMKPYLDLLEVYEGLLEELTSAMNEVESEVSDTIKELYKTLQSELEPVLEALDSAGESVDKIIEDLEED